MISEDSPSSDITVTDAPRFAEADALAIAERHFGISSVVAPLPSERDQNFLITAPDGTRFVLKIANACEERAILDLQNRAMAHLAAHAPALGIRPVRPTIDHAEIGEVTAVDGRPHFVRLVEFVPGVPLARVRPHTRQLLRGVGRRLADMDRALARFEHPAMHRPFHWDLTRTSDARAHLHLVRDEKQRARVERVLVRFEDRVAPLLPALRAQVIHNDWNDYNVLVSEDPTAREVIGAIDFGDMVHAPVICDLAVAAAYAMLGKPDPIAAACDVAGGFHDVLPLTDPELSVLYDLICARLALSVTTAARQQALAPDNAYLGISQRDVPALIERLDGISPEFAHYALRDACGFAACPRSAAVVTWLRKPERRFARVLDPAYFESPPYVLDLSPGSLEIGDLALVSDEASFTALVFGQIDAAGTRVGVGRYDEPRLIYRSDMFRREGNDGPEWRTIHIGLDLFAPAGVTVQAPLAGTVHSVKDNAHPLDYGPTVILAHETPVPFYTLYGHLSRATLDHVRPGQHVESGEVIGWLGKPIENGGWAPHLHFQIITDLLAVRGESPASTETGDAPGPPPHRAQHARRGPRSQGATSENIGPYLSEEQRSEFLAGPPTRVSQRVGVQEGCSAGRMPADFHHGLLSADGDFPGVVLSSERSLWTSVCPDPNLILGLDDRAPAAALSSIDVPNTILDRRRRHIGPSLSISYRRPLTIVRGYLQHLYDDEGRQYLDAVNNVPHVGHGHPRVVSAVARQLAVLNTNTRYLHPLLVEYAERLTSLMPPELSVCYLVSSGSEANELALRLAGAYTSRRGVIVLDGAYHGNTTSLVDISPYKCEGPGGRGLPPHVCKVPLPDLYRGRYRDTDLQAAAKYAAHVGDAARELAAAGADAGVFFCESLVSCGGQIVLPDGYLRDAFAAAHGAGAVVVADEVQVGFGRVGSHTWGFETQSVVPDIVTLGKPIGNGYPLGAVITRPDIAAAFDNGMEFFSTFGGSTAACAAGLAVLDVMRDEALQAHAADVGGYLMERLREVQTRHVVVGDVRGLGLFVGVELVLDPDRREPAPAQASYVANRLRDRGVLVSTDGPDHNVLKIKPPMVFTARDVDRLVDAFDVALGEDAARAG